MASKRVHPHTTDANSKIKKLIACCGLILTTPHQTFARFLPSWRQILAMKKLFTFSALAIVITILFTSCVKQVPFDKRYWLSKERGEVVYSSSTCPHYVIETVNGYAVIRAISSRPYEGDVLYGDFSYPGIKDIYNRSAGVIVSGDVREYWLTYTGAQDALDYYCY